MTDQQIVAQILDSVKRNGLSSLEVTGHSMLPFLRPGLDRVILVPAKEPKKGQILLYQRLGGRYVLHRVWKVEAGRLLMNGDAQPYLESIAPEQVLLMAAARVRKGKVWNFTSVSWRILTALWRCSRRLRPVFFRQYARLRSM